MTGKQDDDPQSPKEPLPAAVEKKVQRHLKAQQQSRRSIWFGLGMFGLVGWAVAVPTLVGIAIGWWLDKKFPGPPSWTLTLLFIGVMIGCYNAWQWIKKESRHD